MPDPRSPPLQPERWLDEHGDVLYRYALAQTRRPDIAQDLVQETLLAAWQGQDKFKRNASERTWLMAFAGIKPSTIFVNRRENSANARRKPTTPPKTRNFSSPTVRGAEAPATWNWEPLRATEAEGFMTVLQQCMAALPAAQRECFELRELGDVETEDAGEVLGVSKSNLYVLLHRARLRLRRCLETHWFDHGDNRL